MNADKTRSITGFTLLELLVVLFLFSAIGALAIPRLTKVYEGISSAAEQDEVLLQLANTGFLVMQRGRGGIIRAYPPDNQVNPPDASESSLPIPLPQGWRLVTARDITYLDNGICLGGTLHAIKGNTDLTIHMKRPFCQPVLEGSP